MNNNFQREGSRSNAHVGATFEKMVLEYFKKNMKNVSLNYGISLGFDKKKIHKFDLGGTENNGREFVVECKSHKWTSGNNVPSAKLTVWNEAMLYFSLLPKNIEKYFFILKDYSEKRNETLAEYYIRTYGHLVPVGVTIIEYDEMIGKASIIFKHYN